MPDFISGTGQLAFSRFVCLFSTALQALVSIVLFGIICYLVASAFGHSEDAANIRENWFALILIPCFALTTTTGAMAHYLTARWCKLRLQNPDQDFPELTRRIKRWHKRSLLFFLAFALTIGGIVVCNILYGE